ncbi:HAMP domain-containing sensor histidine kinase [Erythrobacter sp. HKB08]|uniref:sensor histidine kinase n=1 Tax=Erythrobacter sp. HKB08 TaxID=2502843 RepID=UPI001008E8CC|nr:HAMP domain-containing sensor histidine kinase [Erythrobacter sp. HKB08]
MRLWPKSLLGQTLLAVAAALLVAQAVTSVLLYRVAENRREEGVLTAATFTLWGAPAFRRDRGEELLARGERRMRAPDGMRRGNRRGERPLRGEVTQAYPLLDDEKSSTEWAGELETRLRGLGLEPIEVLATVRHARDDRTLQQRLQRWPATAQRMDLQRGRIFVAAVRWEEGGAWHVARVPYARNDRRVLFVTAAQTFVMFLLLMVVLYFLLRRITRPLAELTGRTERFTASQVAEQPLALRGPEDVQRLITAHNAMETRIASLLDEKDVMLGAIGHDLKTPLAALRVRIESVENETERDKMAASIEDITRTLDDILSLARIGRGNGPPEATDLAALTASVVEEFEDMGKPVTLGEHTRIVRHIHVTWLRRALRNLIANAVRYAGDAEVSVIAEGDAAVLRVDDKGPGIPDGQIERLLEPFQRGEASRNRETGGAGLGLTLARAIAEQHGGTLILANRESGGLRAEIRLPA